MFPQASRVEAVLRREANRLRGRLADDAVIAAGVFGYLNDGTDAETVARERLITVGDDDMWFVDVTRRSGYRGRLLDAAVQTHTQGTRRATDVPGVLRDTGWIVLDIDRIDVTSMALPFAQVVVGRARRRDDLGSQPQPEA
ncbi:MAG: hypothetical protein GY713_21615 [Actinomycetia bacterium]|nr:hypothetical protein [Actinomycetes bacterium]MCP3913533.1 hypothetical protein [Actinomycetes bacterium]